MAIFKSSEFDAPLVRVRGRLYRDGQARFSPCLRTHKPEDEAKSHPGRPTVAPESSVERDARLWEEHRARLARECSAASGRGYFLEFRGASGLVLERAPVSVDFPAQNCAYGRFSRRMPYHDKTTRVVLVHDARELGELVVTTELPRFEIVGPKDIASIDVDGILHLAWHEPDRGKQALITYFVRYGWSEDRWARPGVNLRTDRYDLDLRQMPGSAQCVVELLGTNGYQTAVASLPPFAVAPRPPRLFVATNPGPMLFAQGYSLEAGPLRGQRVAWFAGARHVGSGASFDVRRLGRGRHEISVRASDSAGRSVVSVLGLYDGITGLRLPAHPGL